MTKISHPFFSNLKLNERWTNSESVLKMPQIVKDLQKAGNDLFNANTLLPFLFFPRKGHLSIRNGKGEEIARYCGSNIPHNVRVHGHEASVFYKVHKRDGAQQFQAHWNAVESSPEG